MNSTELMDGHSLESKIRLFLFPFEERETLSLGLESQNNSRLAE